MASGPAMPANAAEDLLGRTLPGGWQVVERVRREPGDTGGNFSINYWVENSDGRKGFCKVLNYWWLLQAQQFGLDPVDAMVEASAVYQFERDLSRACRGLSRIITALDDGSFTLPGYQQGLVSFIIFERAEMDIRRLLNHQDQVDIALRLRAIHQLAAAIRQLHTSRVAHQDVKPSNTLVFEPTLSGSRETKLGDLGRATWDGRPASHDELNIAGDPAYAPPEQLYREVPTDFGERRFACDLYQLGSMISFLFTGTTVNGLLATQLHPDHHWNNWPSGYSGVLPYVRDAFGRSMDIVEASSPASIARDVREMMEQLCDPEPRLRGHPVDRSMPGNQFRLDRIVTRLDLLSRRVAVELVRAR